MSSEYELNATEVDWSEARESILSVNPELVEIIDRISPDKRHKLLKVNYQFGDEILEKAQLNLPLKAGGVISIHDSNVSADIKDNYGYNMGSNPVSIVTDSALELFMAFRGRIIPYALVKPGNLLGLWKTVEPDISHSPKSSLWGLTAGVRSVFMLPKIAEARKFHKLNQALKIYVEKPSNLTQHWEIFKKITHSLDCTWGCKLLFFSRTWFDSLKDPGWQELQNFFYKQVVNSSSFWRNQYIWDLIFSIIQDNAHMKHPAYVVNIAKHLFMLAIGVVPGFAPGLDDFMAPISQIESVFRDIYNLKYEPLVMQPSYLLPLEKSNPIYYSLHMHTALEFSPKQNDRLSTAADMYLLRLFINHSLREIRNNNLGLEGVLLHHISDKLNFEFFHSDVGQYNEIITSQMLPNYDDNFSRFLSQGSFPVNAPFVRGCIQISLDNNKS